MKVFSITDIPEFSKKERIVVVGVIGKSPYRYPNKTTPLVSSVQSKENAIECHWDERRSILFLHTITYLDTVRLTELAANLNEDSKCTEKDADPAHWLVASGELATESCRAIALLFHLCHIVVLSSPNSVFDLGYLQLFKAIDTFRTELLPHITDALTSLGLGSAWETHGRSCCPRLLFHFRRAPTPLKKAPAALKRLEHAVEDQLYFILRKARIITNVCAKSLFAIPKNEEFVYMSADDELGCARDVSSLVQGLAQLCGGAAPQPRAERPTFAQFLQAHVDLAFAEGFDDNVGKYAMTTSFFELPSASCWRAAARALSPLHLSSASSVEHADASATLYDALATDVRFSHARCAKVLPIAQASYAEGLPAHYSSQHHAHKVSVALGVLETMARGPLAGGARERLREACEATWRARSLCEAPSLTHHPCIEPEHDGSKEHNSGVRYISACNCGRTKCSRADPYTAIAANQTFYARAREECSACPTLQNIPFPVFQPSTPTYRAASVKGAASQEEKDVSEARGSTPVSGNTPDGGWSAPDALSPGSAGDDDDEDEKTPSDGNRIVVPVRVLAANEKVMSRQPSTTEYLPGMLHTASPAGLLPAFSSWSLVCLGPSSLYSHSLGLPEHLQPGFLPHSGHCAPWDCAVPCVEQVSVWRQQQAASRGRGKSTASHPLTVKIFIGFEYECPRGHRFMMSSPDTVVNGSGGCTREAGALGAKLAATDMPLRTWCPCRPAPASSVSGGMRAQLARVHVVTPKAPVHVVLNPRVQPVEGGPTFIPQPAGSPPVTLSASAYWVLRLPYVYCDERGCMPPPRSGTSAVGKLLAPVAQNINRRRGGSKEHRHSLGNFLGFEAPLAEPSPPNNHRGNDYGNWHWEEPGSPEAGQTPRALVPAACFPPRHPRDYTSFSESARPGSGWSDETTSGQGITDLVESLKALSMPPSAPQTVKRVKTIQLRLSYDAMEKNSGPPWSDQTLATRELACQLPRRSSFCGVLPSVRNGTTAITWTGSLPTRGADASGGYSPKVFLGGLPWDITEHALMNTLAHFQPLRVEWPGRDCAGAGSPRGYAYVTFDTERSVRALLGASRRNQTGWYYRVASRKMRTKEVQVIPWAVSDCNWVSGGSVRLEPSRTVFVGALHGMLTAHALATIMQDLFQGVVYAGIDTDKNKYPIGSGRVTFNNVRSYVRAISAAYVEICTDKFTKKVQVDPYLEDSMCSVCNLHQGPYFCREPVCFRYLCWSCWVWAHPQGEHTPLSRGLARHKQDALAIEGTPSPSNSGASTSGTSGTEFDPSAGIEECDPWLMH